MLIRSFFSILLLFIVNSAICYGQSSLGNQSEHNITFCLYQLTYKPDSTSSATRTEQMRLEIGDKLSKFESKIFFLHDSLMKRNNSLPGRKTQQSLQLYIDQIAALPISTFKYTIFKNASQNKIFCYDRIGYILYRYEELASPMKWQLIPGKTATLAGYKCQQATTTFAGRKFEAWFTREVPISEGPYKFYGLPGLIVKISDTKQDYVFDLVKLTKVKNVSDIKLPTQVATFTTKAELRKGQLAYQNSMIDRLAAMGNEVTPENRKANMLRIKKQNNPLEIKP